MADTFFFSFTRKRYFLHTISSRLRAGVDFTKAAGAIKNSTHKAVTTQLLPKLSFTLALFILHVTSSRLSSQSTGDSLENRILSCASQGYVADDLSAAFQSNPKGEFLLAPQNKDLRYAILIYNIDILPTKAVFSAAMAFREAHGNQLVALRADNVVFSKTHGLIGPVTLYLLQNVHFTLGRVVSITMLSPLANTQSGTYATMECRGLKEFGIQGHADFNSEYILPTNDTGAVLSGKRMQAAFSLKARNWGDMVAQLSLPPFQVKGLKDFVFRIQGATLDLSETSNIPGIVFPTAYTSQGVLGANPEIWEGFYLQNGSVAFPPHFRQSSGQRLSAGVQKMFIDENGFSGGIYAQNILAFEKGKIAGWNISIEKVQINLVFNSIAGGLIEGGLGLPVLPDTSRLHYLARVGPDDNYVFAVSVDKNLTIPALRVAKLSLIQGSFVNAEIDNGNVYLLTNLSGSMHIASSKGDAHFHFPAIEFQNLSVSNRKPKFGIEYLGIKDTGNSPTFSKFPLTIQSVALKGKEDKYELSFAFKLHLTEYIGAEAGLTIACEFKTINGYDRLVFNSLNLNRVAVDFEKSGIKIHGVIDVFKEDPNYGNGFDGSISFNIKSVKIQGSAKALFGTVSGVRYWYFDAAILWGSPGIPVFAGVNLNGFVGGAWHRMRAMNAADKILNKQIGQTELGAVFVPDEKMGIGLRAGVYINGGSSTSYQAKTIFEMQSNAFGGIQKMMFYGDLQIMPKETLSDKKSIVTSANIVPPSGDAWKDYLNNYKPKTEIGGPFMLQFDFANQCFSANASVYINEIANGTLSGAGTNNSAGELSAFFGTKKWYIRAGEPLHPLGLKIKIGNQAGILITSYFISGTELLPANDAPAEVAQYLNLPSKMDALRDINSLAEGSGFAFGASLKAVASAGATEKSFSVYASLQAIMGFDIDIRKYKTATVCGESGETPGIRNWYGGGNLYTFIQGKVGVKMGKLRIDALTLTGALVMNIKAPNPIEAKGAVYLEFNLGGVLRFNRNIDVNLGTPCNLQVNSYSDSSVIRQIYPAHNSTNVNPISDIFIDFTVPVNTNFELPDKRVLKFKLLPPIVTESSNTLTGNWVLDENNTRAFFRHSLPLPELKQIKVSVNIVLVQVTGSLENPVIVDKNIVQEKQESVFTSGKMPNSIPIDNIDYAYPWVEQLNYHKIESKKCFIKLKIKQDNIFNSVGMKIVARFYNYKFDIVDESVVKYSNGIIEYAAPLLLNKGENYRLRFYKVPQSTPSAVGPGSANAGSGISNVQLLSGNTNPSGSTSSSTSQSQLSLILEYWFRCSEYETLKDKINDMKCVSSEYKPGSGFYSNMQYTMVSGKNEYFEEKEISDENKMNTIVRMAAESASTPWIQSELVNKMYSIVKQIPSSILLSRDTLEYGLIPLKAVNYEQSFLNSEKLNVKEISRGNKFVFIDKEIKINYNLPFVVERDIIDIKNMLSGMAQVTIAYNSIIQNYIKLFGSTSISGSSRKSITPSMPFPTSVILPIMPTAVASPVSVASVKSSVNATIVNTGLLKQLQQLQIKQLPKPGTYGFKWAYYLPGYLNPTSTFVSTIAVK